MNGPDDTERRDEIRRLLTLSETELYELLGTFAPASAQARDGRDPSSVRLWIQASVSAARAKVCGLAEVEDFIEGRESYDEVTLVCMVADALAATFSGLPLLAVSSLVVKIGLRRLCDGFRQR